MKQVLTKLLTDYPENIVEDAFLRIAPLQKLHVLHEGLKLFMHHFLIIKNSDKPAIIKDRVKLAEKILSSQSNHLLWNKLLNFFVLHIFFFFLWSSYQK